MAAFFFSVFAQTKVDISLDSLEHKVMPQHIENASGKHIQSKQPRTHEKRGRMSNER
ncbi:MAG: hypothetical protein ACYCZA_00700 [Thiobacillus sp.]